MSKAKQCKFCEDYDPIDDVHGRCECKKFVLGYQHYYGHPFKDGTIDLDGVSVEDDEGWGFRVGKDFGCIHHRTAFSRSVDENGQDNG